MKKQSKRLIKPKGALLIRRADDSYLIESINLFNKRKELKIKFKLSYSTRYLKIKVQ